MSGAVCFLGGKLAPPKNLIEFGACPSCRRHAFIQPSSRALKGGLVSARALVRWHGDRVRDRPWGTVERGSEDNLVRGRLRVAAERGRRDNPDIHPFARPVTSIP